MGLEALERRIRRLEELEEIKQLKARYAAYCDANYDADALAALFTADAIWDGGILGYNEGRKVIRQFFRGSSQHIAFALHYIVSSIVEIDGDTASGTCASRPTSPIALYETNTIGYVGLHKLDGNELRGMYLLTEAPCPLRCASAGFHANNEWGQLRGYTAAALPASGVF